MGLTHAADLTLLDLFLDVFALRSALRAQSDLGDAGRHAVARW